MTDATQTSNAVLITGASGLLGGNVLRRLLADTDRPIVALVRRPLELDHPRLHEVYGDLAEGPLPEVDFDVTTVIHCAASISFVWPIEEQRAINVEGTERMLQLAATFPGLERFQHVSTAYVAGTHEGLFGPDDLDRGQGFRNTYEQSKWEAEVLVRASGLPVQIIRPSIVVGDQYTGETNAFNVLYPPMRAYAHGKLQIAPGRGDAPVDVVPIDVVADGMIALLSEPVGGTHLIVAGPKSLTVQGMIDLGAKRFGRSASGLVPMAQLREMIAQLPDEQREVAEQALDRSAALVPYFDVSCEFDDPATTEILARHGIRVPQVPEYFDTLMDYAVEANWGKAPVPAQS
jgi:thioester reductase-like protein